MSLLDYSEIREKKIILHEGEPCEVVESHVARTQQRKPQNQVKLKSLISGKTFAATFHVSDTADEADVSKREIKFLFHNKGEYWFADPKDPKNRFKLDEKILNANTIKFLKENTIANAMVFEDEDEVETIIQVKLPVKMEFTVKEAPPSMRGNTASGGGKVVVLENGTTLTTPMFVEAGDRIIVNTDTGEYVERAGK
jgi:elongation factor P